MKLLVLFLFRCVQILIEFACSLIEVKVLFLCYLLLFWLLPWGFIVFYLGVFKSGVLVRGLLLILKLPIFSMNVMYFVLKVFKAVLKRTKLIFEFLHLILFIAHFLSSLSSSIALLVVCILLFNTIKFDNHFFFALLL